MGVLQLYVHLIATLMLLVSALNAHRILGLFPHNGISHFQFFHPIMTALAEAGHEVTVVSHFPNTKPVENYKDEPLIGKHDLKNFVSLDVSLN